MEDKRQVAEEIANKMIGDKVNKTASDLLLLPITQRTQGRNKVDKAATEEWEGLMKARFPGVDSFDDVTNIFKGVWGPALTGEVAKLLATKKA